MGAAGCGGRAKTPAERVAGCLDAKGFLVQAAGGPRVEGTSPGGVGFTVLASSGRIDDSGNPHGRRLGRRDRAAIRACVKRR